MIKRRITGILLIIMLTLNSASFGALFSASASGDFGIYVLAEFRDVYVDTRVDGNGVSQSNDFGYGEDNTNSLCWTLKKDGFLQFYPDAGPDWREYGKVNIRLCSEKPGQNFNMVFHAKETGNIYNRYAAVTTGQWQVLSYDISELTAIASSADKKSIGRILFNAGGWSLGGYEEGTDIYIDSIWLSHSDYGTVMQNPVPSVEDTAGNVSPALDGANTLSFEFEKELYEAQDMKSSVRVYEVNGENEALSDIGYDVRVSGNILDVVFDEELESPMTYKVVLDCGKIYSSGGAMLGADYIIYFSVGMESAIFKVVNTSPFNNSDGVDASADGSFGEGYEWIITFNNTLDSGKDYSKLIYITENDALYSDYQIFADGKALVCRFTKALESESSYRMELSEDFKDANENGLTGDRIFTFTTGKMKEYVGYDGVVFDSAVDKHKNGLTLTQENTYIYESVPITSWVKGGSADVTYSTRCVDITAFGYINYLMYIPEASSDKINLLYTNNGARSYKKYSPSTDKEGWHILSVPLSAFEPTTYDNKPVDEKKVDKFYLNVGGWGNTRNTGSYLLMGKIWLTNEPIEGSLDIEYAEIENQADFVDSSLGGDNCVTYGFSKELLEKDYSGKIKVEKYNGSGFEQYHGFSAFTFGTELNVEFEPALSTGDTIRIEIPAGCIVSSQFIGNAEVIETIFTVETATPYFKVTETSVQNGAVIDAQSDFEYVLSFNNELNPLQYLSDYISIYKSGDRIFSGYTMKRDKKKITVEFDGVLEKGSEYTIKIDAKFKDAYDNAITGDTEFEFAVKGETSFGDIIVFSAGNNSHMSDVVGYGHATENFTDTNLYESNARVDFEAGKQMGSYFTLDKDVDVSDMNYVNAWIYSPASNLGGVMNFVTHIDRAGNKYVNTKVTIDWEGWKLISLDISDMEVIDSVYLNFGGWESPWTRDGYILVDAIWYSSAIPEPLMLVSTNVPSGSTGIKCDGAVIKGKVQGLSSSQNPLVTLVDEDGNQVYDFDISFTQDEVIITLGMLRPSCEYTLSVNGIVGSQLVVQEIPVSLTFVTSGGDFIVENMSFDKTSLVAGMSLNLDAVLNNMTPDTKNATLNLTAYDNNGIGIYTASEKVSVNAGESITAGVYAQNVPAGATYIKGYVLCGDRIVSNKYITLKKSAVLNIPDMVSGASSLVKITDMKLDVNVLSLKGLVSGVSNTVLLSIVAPDGSVVAEEPISASGSGEFSYGCILGSQFDDGVYVINAVSDGIRASESITFVSEDKGREFVSLANGKDADKLADFLKDNSELLSITGIDGEKYEDIAVVLMENGEYLIYSDVYSMMNHIIDVLKGLNSLRWAAMSDYIFENSDILLGKNNEDVKYFAGISELAANNICMELAEKMPYNTISDFRKEFSSEIKAYKASLDDDKKGGGSGGGGGKKTSATFDGDSVVSPVYTPSHDETVFKDLAGYDWATESIMKLYSMGIISPSSDNCYRPADNITREEFVKLVMVAFFADRLNSGGKIFSDTSDGAWYNIYLSSAASLGIVTGKTDGSFGIGECITREDMVTIVCRALESKGTAISPDSSEVYFTDMKLVSEYAGEYVTALAQTGVISGMGDGSFAPKANANRAQAAKIIAQLISLYGQEVA